MYVDSDDLLADYNVILFAYNADGEITSIGDNFSRYAYTFDGQGDVASVDNGGTPGVPDVVLASGYDAAGNRSSLSATIGGTKDFLNSYSYDTLSRLITMQQVNQNGGNVVASKEVDYSYDAIGDVTRRSGYNFVGVGPRYDIATSSISYNTLGQLTGISMTSYAGVVSLDNLTYSYDTLGRVSTFGSIDGTATYGYDKTSQLTSASYVAASGHVEPPNFSVTFDPNGNRSTVNGASTAISTNNEVTNDGTFTYQFDAEGNRTVRTRISSAYAADYKTTYSWDYRNRLTDVENFDNNGVLTQHVHYVYDVFDRLIEREFDPNGKGTYTTDTHYVWDASAPPTLGPAGQPPNAPGNIVLAFNGSEQLTTRYLVGPNTSAYDQYLTPLVEEDVTSTSQGGTLTFDLPDKQGSLIDVADNNDALANHVVDTAFGQVFSETNPSVPHLAGFGGGIYDSATQLINNIERWYDPLATVWISVDPTGFAAGDTNESRYVGNAPADLADPGGLAPPKLGPVSGYLEGVANRNKGNILIHACAGTLSGIVSIFDTLGGAVDAAAARSAIKTAKTDKHPLNRAAARVAVVYVTAGEGFALYGVGEAQAGLVCAPVAITKGRVAPVQSPKNNVPPLRDAYIREVRSLERTESAMRAAGKSAEEIARELHGMRRSLGVKYKDLTPPGKRAEIYKRNVRKYGDELGPTIDFLRQKGKSWEEIIESAKRPGGQDINFNK